MSVTINGTNGLTFSDASVQNTAATGFGFKNRIINGAMMIDQRNAGASVTTSTVGSGTYTVDRWQYYVDVGSKLTLQQSSTAPSGFTNSLVATVISTDSTANSSQLLRTKIEGFNVSDLGWGAAGASTVSLSFWVRASVTGSYAGYIQNSASNRSYVFSYSVASANTWEQKTITISGDTTGTWLTNNGIGLLVGFQLGIGYNATTINTWAAGNYQTYSGNTNLCATNGATFYITGVQLEKGSTATSFDYRPYGTELALCQRYYYQWSNSGLSDTPAAASPYVSSPPNSTAALPMYFPVIMRASPTVAGVASNGTLNRQTSVTNMVVFQWASTVSGNFYTINSYTATAEL